MPLTGEINDLSLSELIELFCNRRKTGRLTVVYPQGAAEFYLRPGVIVHAAFADLNGVEAVHFALTLPNASFTFQAGVEAPERSIDQPWTSVVLEGLRRIDEGVLPAKPSANGKNKVQLRYVTAAEGNQQPGYSENKIDDVKAFGVLLSQMPESAPPRRWLNLPVLIAIVLIVLGIGVPWGWYTRQQATKIRRESDEKRFEHLYQQTEPASQPNGAATNNSAQVADQNSKSLKKQTEGEKPPEPRDSP